mmetsp:Transcript_28513/g.60166  ORF Transcript_28513/g.60166 Transcript_28513/m.60166 type:complete len:225 (+) Transcript_28513:76-750(+)
MNLLPAFAFLASMSVAEGRIFDRALGRPDQDGKCGSFDVDFAAPWDCWDAGAVCSFEVCIAGDKPQRAFARSQPFFNLATWRPEDPEASLQCFPARGYWNQQLPVYADDGNQIGEKTVGHGHGLLIFSPEGGDSVDDSVKNVRSPGMYWIQGGTITFEGDDCWVDEELKWICSNSIVTKAEGKFIDLCSEMGAQTSHCDQIFNRIECKRVNTCTWVGDECTYSA